MNTLPRVIAHVDADCFFASVELLSRPDLRGKPVLVCNRNDRRGIVVSATYEARPFGIRAGTPVFKAQKQCPQGIYIESHFDRYEEASLQLMRILRNFSPDVEAASIDEAYIDLTGTSPFMKQSYKEIAETIQKTVYQKLGITISFGLASSKLLAKIASDFKKPHGLTVVTPETREAFLKQVPIENIPGIGRRSAPALRSRGFLTAYDCATNPAFPMLFGKRGKDMVTELNGTMLSRVETTDSAPKSLSHTRTFPDFSSDRRFIFSFSLAQLLALTRRLREHGLHAKAMNFFLLTKDFHPREHMTTFFSPTDEEKTFIEAFSKSFEEIFCHGTVYRKSGFFLSSLSPKGPLQHSLFETPRSTQLESALDQIFKKFGGRGISRGSLLKIPVKTNFSA